MRYLYVGRAIQGATEIVSGFVPSVPYQPDQNGTDLTTERNRLAWEGYGGPTNVTRLSVLRPLDGIWSVTNQ